MTQKERMEKGLLYCCLDKDIMQKQAKCQKAFCEYNLTKPDESDKRQSILKQAFGAVGERCCLEPPVYANWGGRNVYLGNDVYSNYHLTLVDDGNIYIGDNVMFGPNVTLTTAGHPIEPELRKKYFQFNKDIHIGNNVWIGSGVTVLPGVTIGNNSVIGAGSVVTKDIPPDVVAFGNPCRVQRSIGERDREYFYKNERIDYENIDEMP